MLLQGKMLPIFRYFLHIDYKTLGKPVLLHIKKLMY